MRLSLIPLALLVLVPGCKTIAPAPPAPADIDPVRAVLDAAASPEGVTGVFRMEVRGTSRQGDWLYLHSEADYRDLRSLTIAIPSPIARDIEKLLQGDPAELLKGRTVRVMGTAKRTTIWFFANGVRTESFYYQTHIIVRELEQFEIVADGTFRTEHGGPVTNPRVERDPRGVQYVDYVPSPAEIKEHLEEDGWTDVRIVRTFPDYLHGPIRALALFDSSLGVFPTGVAVSAPQNYGRVLFDRIQYLNLELGANGIVTAPLVMPDGRTAVTFHLAAKSHYVMIIWDPTQRTGYVWRSFIYNSDGTPTEMRFLMQRQDLERI
ncbi:MAG TPA: hypothetical protein VMM36_00150 [Opitutaceae bacterium]|nr:hypothetical protein [Opitutaceae bacterium]